MQIESPATFFSLILASKEYNEGSDDGVLLLQGPWNLVVAQRHALYRARRKMPQDSPVQSIMLFLRHSHFKGVTTLKQAQKLLLLPHEKDKVELGWQLRARPAFSFSTLAPSFQEHIKALYADNSQPAGGQPAPDTPATPQRPQDTNQFRQIMQSEVPYLRLLHSRKDVEAELRKRPNMTEELLTALLSEIFKDDPQLE